MGTAPESARGGEELITITHAMMLDEPYCVSGIFHQNPHKFWIGLFIASCEGVIVKPFDRIFDALGLLTNRIDGVKLPLGGIRVAPRERHLVKHNHARASIQGLDGCAKGGQASAYHYDVAFLIDGRRGRKPIRCLAQNLHIATGLFEAVLHRHAHGNAGKGSTRHRVDVQRLAGKILLAHNTDSLGTDMARVAAHDPEVFKTVRPKLSGNGDIAIATRE